MIKFVENARRDPFLQCLSSTTNKIQRFLACFQCESSSEQQQSLLKSGILALVVLIAVSCVGFIRVLQQWEAQDQKILALTNSEPLPRWLRVWSHFHAGSGETRLTWQGTFGSVRAENARYCLLKFTQPSGEVCYCKLLKPIDQRGRSNSRFRLEFYMDSDSRNVLSGLTYFARPEALHPSSDLLVSFDVTANGLAFATYISVNGQGRILVPSQTTNATVFSPEVDEFSEALEFDTLLMQPITRRPIRVQNLPQLVQTLKQQGFSIPE